MELLQTSASKRKRSNNYSLKEIEQLVNLVTHHKAVIECKKTDTITISQKDYVWTKITENFNNSLETGRTKENLKSKWDSIKKNIRKDIANMKKSLKATGGGPAAKIDLSSVGERVLSIIGISATGLENSFDCDANNGSKEIEDESPPPPVETTFTIEAENLQQNDCEYARSPRASEWQEWSPEILKTPKSSPIKSSEETSPKNRLPCYRPKKRRKDTKEDKEIYKNLAENKLDLVSLQMRLLQEEHDERMRQNLEQHNIQMEILRTELAIKKRELLNS